MPRILKPNLPLHSKLAKAFLTLLIAFVSLNSAPAQQSEREEIKERIATYRAKKKAYTKDSVYIDLLLDLGSHLRFYNADSLLILANQALDYSTGAGYRKGESKSLLLLGDFYSDKGNYGQAIDHYTQAFNVAREIEDFSLTLRTMNNLAGEYSYMGDYARALNGYLQGIELAEKTGDKKMLSIMNENIANLYASQKDYEQSLAFYNKVKKINDEIGNEVYSAETMSNLASVYADIGKLDYAMFNVNKSIATFEKHAIMDWLAFAYETKGKVYLKLQKYKWALYWYNQSEMIHRNLEDDRGKIDLYNGIAEAHLAMDKEELSQQYALKAIEISNRIKFLEGTRKCAKTLYNINKNKKDYATALSYHELYQKLSDTLSRNENQKSLTMLKTKTEYDKQKVALMEENEKALARQKRYINAALFFLLIFVAVTLLVHRGQKIQKKLNTVLQAKKEILEKRESELRENNETKTKLFSIIGHDLRGPIGALQGVLTLFTDGEVSKNEFLKFIPKIKTDIDNISFTLNNLLSWGYSQLNGSVTNPTVVALDSLVGENISLLGEVAKSKSIRIVNEIPENTRIWSDGNQIDIVIRNLISNALKFTPENGMVTISATDKDEFWEIAIRDTGVGMDKLTVEKLFDKNSNVTTYGTNNEKGTGLGLSLCREMVKKNNGDIWVESSLRKGSTFYFKLPKSAKEYSRAS